MSNPFILYCHIEKCAGMTLNYLLANNFPNMIYPSPVRNTNDPHRAFSDKHLKRLLKVFPAVQGISGHNVRPFVDYKNVVKKDTFMFTFFREPISRYMSHLNYQRTKMNIDWDVAEFVENKHMNDFQTVKIAGSNDIELARHIINSKLDFYGFTEFFDQSIYLLNKSFTFTIDPKYFLRNAMPVKNRSKLKPILWKDLSVGMQKKIIENNLNDAKIYNYCLERFKENYFQLTGNNSMDHFKDNYRIGSKSAFYYYSMILKKTYRKVIEPLLFSNYLSKREKR